MTSLKVKRELTRWLTSIIELDRRSSHCKEVMTSQPGYHSIKIFSLLDTLQNNYICCSDFQRFLVPRLKVSKEEISHLFSHWDHSIEGKFDYEALRKCLGLERETEDPETIALSYNIEYAFTRMLETELKGLRKIEKHRVRLIHFKEFGLISSFKDLDTLHQGFLSTEGLFAFLTEMSVNVTLEDVKSIFKRYDKDNDGKISYIEYSDAILPNSKKNRMKPKNISKIKSSENILTIEDVRRKLSLRSDFSLPDAFCFFSKKERISEKQLTLGLYKLGFKINTLDVQAILRRFGRKLTINYNQLCKILEPKIEKYANLLYSRVPQSILGTPFSQETLQLLAQFFELLINDTKYSKTKVVVPSVLQESRRLSL